MSKSWEIFVIKKQTLVKIFWTRWQSRPIYSPLYNAWFPLIWTKVYKKVGCMLYKNCKLCSKNYKDFLLGRECVHAKLLESCLTVTLKDCSPPGPSVYRIFQARILEWVALPSSRESSWLRDQTHVFLCLLHWQAGYLPLAPPGKLQKEHRQDKWKKKWCAYYQYFTIIK